MNYVELSIAIKKEPNTYKKEFFKQHDFLMSILMLSKPNLVELKSVFIFILRNIIRYSKEEIENLLYNDLYIRYLKVNNIYYNYCDNHFYTKSCTNCKNCSEIKKYNFYTVILSTLSLLQNKEKVPILNELILVAKCGIISKTELFRIYLTNGYNCDKLEEFLCEEIDGILKEFYTREDCMEKTKRIAFFYILKYISKYNNNDKFNDILLDVIKNREDIKLHKYAIYFFNDQLDIAIKSYDSIFGNNLNFKNRFISLIHDTLLESSFDNEEYSILLDIFIKITNTGSIEIIKQLVNHSDVNKHVQRLYKLILKCKTKSDKLNVINIIFEDMINYREDEVTAQGINLLREMYRNEKNENIINKIKSIVELYKQSNNKTLVFAYKSFLNVVKKKNEKNIKNDSEIKETESTDSVSSSCDDVNMFVVKKTPTKEEKEGKRLKGRKKIQKNKFTKNKKRVPGKKGKTKSQSKKKLCRQRKKH